MINELNNNSIFTATGKKKQLPDSVIDSKADIGRIAGLYKNDDGYRPYTIYGKPGKFLLWTFIAWFTDVLPDKFGILFIGDRSACSVYSFFFLSSFNYFI